MMHSYYLVFSNTFERPRCISCNSYPDRKLALHQTSFRAKCLNVDTHKRYTVRHSEHGLSWLPKLQSLKEWMCFNTNILKYTTRIPTKLKKVLKKRFTIGPKAPQCNMRKKRLQKPSTALQSVSWTCSCVSGLVRTNSILSVKTQSSRFGVVSMRWLMSSSTEPTFSFCRCYSIYHRRVSCLDFLSDVYISC